MPEGDRGVVDQGLGVEMGEVADLGVGCLLGEGDEDLGGPGAVDGVVGLELLGVPVGGAEAAVLEGGGVGLAGDDPAGVQGAEFDFGAIFDGERFVGEEATGWAEEFEGVLGRWGGGLGQPPELFVEGELAGLGGGIEREFEEVGEEWAVGVSAVGVFVLEGVDIFAFVRIAGMEWDVFERRMDERSDMIGPLLCGGEIGLVGSHA